MPTVRARLLAISLHSAGLNGWMSPGGPSITAVVAGAGGGGGVLVGSDGAPLQALRNKTANVIPTNIFRCLFAFMLAFLLLSGAQHLVIA